MDARAVAEIAEIEVGTLNVWVQRGIIPGMSVGTRGRQRDIDLETAIFILGYGRTRKNRFRRSRCITSRNVLAPLATTALCEAPVKEG